MSVVLAIKSGDAIYLGTDSQVSYGGTKKLITNPTSFKIWRPVGHKHLIVGGVGALRDLNILSTVDVWFDEVEVTGSETKEFELDFSYVVRTLAPAIRAELERYTPQGSEPSNSSFVFAYKDKCYEIAPCGSVNELAYEGDFVAIGSGGTITTAVYSAIQDLEDMPLKEKMIRSLAQACEDDLYVSYPILLMDTASSHTEVFDGEYLHISSDKVIHFNDLREYYSEIEDDELDNELDTELVEEIRKEFSIEVQDGTAEEIKKMLNEESQS